MCPPLLKKCSWVIAQFNSLWRHRLTSVAFPCVLTQDAYRRLRNLRRVFLRFGTVFSFRSIREFISFGKRIIFLTVRCKNWCQEISSHKVFKVVFLALLAGVQNMREIMVVQWLQFRHKLLKERMTLIQRINRCSAIRKTDVLSFGNFDKTPIKTLEFVAREFSSIGRLILFSSLRWRNKRSCILSAVVYIHYIWPFLA